jgi:hypothetical protein
MNGRNEGTRFDRFGPGSSSCNLVVGRCGDSHHEKILRAQGIFFEGYAVGISGTLRLYADRRIEIPLPAPVQIPARA